MKYPPSLRDDCDPELHDNPEDCGNREQQKHNGAADDAGYIQPGLLRFSIGLSGSPPQQFGISRVAPKPNGEEIAENRNRTDSSIDQKVQAHPCDDDLRHTKPRGQYQDDGPDKIGEQVTDSWNQSKQRIESEIERCAGDFDSGIQNLGQEFSRRHHGVSLRIGR